MESYARKLAKLLQIETVSDIDNVDAAKFQAFRDALRQMFPRLFAACDFEDFGAAFLLRWPGANTAAQPILFMNHHDVVSPNGAWTSHEPFSGDIADGAVWGRGALDTKSGLFSMLQAAEELLEAGFTPDCDIYFESSCDEETDGSGCESVVRALKQRGVHLRFCLDEGGYIVHDPLGGANGDFAMVGVGEKCFVSIKFTARGEGGHSSRPGKNTPLVRLARFVATADRRAKGGSLFDVELSPTIAEMLRRMAPTVKPPLSKAFADPERAAVLLKRAMPAVSDNAAALMRTTVAFTMASGSEGYNVLPSEAWVVANMRCSHHQGKAASIKALCKLAKRFNLECEVLEESPESPLSSYDSDEFRALERCINRTYPSVIVAPYVMAGASDARFMGDICDACFRFVPIAITDQQLQSIHGVDENVTASCLAPAVATYKDLMQEVSRCKA